MFDLNQILSAALNAAVQQAIAPLVERISQLEAENKAYDIVFKTQHERIAALENNPAQGAVTPLDAAAFVNYLDEQEWFWDKVGRVAINEKALDAVRDVARDVAETVAEEAISEHCSDYDHDEYDNVANEWGSESTGDFIKDDGGIEDKINEALRNATFSISV